jgi:hypothetical protein
VTFQSTSSTNISTVNALNENQLFVREKERGRGSGKRKWAIEMNEGRQLYLSSYGRIDTIDSLIKACGMYYVSWKYWHACKLHVQALGVVVAYDMYKEVVEEGFAAFGFESKDEATKKCFLDFHSFRDKLSLQGLHYTPEQKKYPGDSKMRVCTKRGGNSTAQAGPKRGRGRPKKSVTPDGAAPAEEGMTAVTRHQFKQEKKDAGSRLCGNLDKYALHCKSVKTVKHKLKCRWCAKPCHTYCGICKMPAHNVPKRGKCTGSHCFAELHNDQRYGLAATDCSLLKKDKKTWELPSAEAIAANSRHIDEIQRNNPYSLRGRARTVEDSI